MLSTHHSLANCNRYAQQEIVTIFVGKERKLYRLHKDLLRNRSPYFATRLKDCWDGTQAEIELTHVSTRSFEVAIDWMYSESVPEYVPKKIGDKGPLLIDLAELYQVADLLMITQLQNQLVDTELHDARELENHWTLAGVVSAHVHGVTHTPLYQLILKDYVKHMLDEPLGVNAFRNKTAILQEHPQAAIDVLHTIHDYNRSKWAYPCNGNFCEFHVHPDGQICDSSSESPPNKKIKRP